MGFWSELILPRAGIIASPEIAALERRWPKDLTSYRLDLFVKFAKKALDHAIAAQFEMSKIVGQKAVLAWGPSDELINNLNTMVDEMHSISKRLTRNIRDAQAAQRAGMIGVKLPTFREDFFRLMGLSATGSGMAKAEGGPSWFSRATLGAFEVLMVPGFFTRKVGKKVIDLGEFVFDWFEWVMWGALGLGGLYVYTKYIKKDKKS